MDWTTALINGEQEYVDINAKPQHTISSASRGPSSRNSSNGGASGGGKPPAVHKQWKVTTGEPTGPIMHALDIRILYTDPSKADEDPYKTQLPALTHDWFKNNKNKQVPAKFKNYSGSNSTSKSKKKNSNKRLSSSILSHLLKQMMMALLLTKSTTMNYPQPLD